MPAPEPLVLVLASEPVFPRPMSLVDSPVASVWPRPAGPANPRHIVQPELVSRQYHLSSPSHFSRRFGFRGRLVLNVSFCDHRRSGLCPPQPRPGDFRCPSFLAAKDYGTWFTTVSQWSYLLLTDAKYRPWTLARSPSMTHDTLTPGGPNHNEALCTR